MKVSKIVKTVVKYGPLVYPIVKKVLDEKKKTATTTKSSTQKGK